MDPEVKRSLRGAGRISAVGIEMGLCVGIGVFAGHVVDGYWGTAPWGVVFGSILGLAAAGSSLYKTYKWAKKLGNTKE